MKKVLAVIAILFTLLLVACKAKTFKISFYDENNVLLGEVQVEKGAVIDASQIPAIPEKKGYTGHYGIKDSKTPFDPLSATDSIDLYVYYDKIEAKMITLNFYNEDLSLLKAVTFEEGKAIALADIPEVPNKAGYTGFWALKNDTAASDILAISSNADLYAKYEKNAVDVTITYHYNNPDSVQVVYAKSDETLNKYNITVEYENHTFKGWFLDQDLKTPLDANALVGEENIHLYASWEAAIVEYKVVTYIQQADDTFVKGEEEVKSCALNSEVTISAPEKSGYCLIPDFTVEITKVDYEVRVEYLRREYTIFVATNIDTIVTEIKVKYLGTIDINPALPMGHTLEKIELSDQTPVPAVMPDHDLDVVITYNARLYPITYVLNGGEATEQLVEEYTFGVGLATLPTVKCGRLEFLGWSTRPNGDTYLTSIGTSQIGELTLYAIFGEETSYDVTYVLNGGSTRYKSRDELVADFLADFKNVTGKTVAADGLYAVGNHYGTFYANKEMFDKWIWLVEYFYDLGAAGKGYHSESQAQYKKFIEGNGQDVTSQWAVRQNTQGFMTKVKCGKYSGAAAIDFSVYDDANNFWSYIEDEIVVTGAITTTEMVVYKEFYTLEGWYDNPQLAGDAVTDVNKTTKLYAKWEEAIPITSIEVTNAITEMEVKSSLQLNITIHPSTVPASTKLVYKSSNPDVIKIDDNGFMQALNVGTTTITICNKLETIETKLTIIVFCPDFIDLKFSDGFNSTLDIDEIAKIIPTAYGKNTQTQVLYSSSDENVVTVDATGEMKGISYGKASITARLQADETVAIVFPVTVLDKKYATGTIDDLLNALIKANEEVTYTGNVCLYNSATKLYRPTYGSVNLFLFDDINIDRTTYLIDPTVSTNKTSGVKSSTEFITIHDTANYSGGLKNHGSYWADTGHTTSIHFTVGDYGVIQDLPTNYKGHHAGDSSAPAFTWNDTGIKSTGAKPKISINAQGYFTINGTATPIAAPRNKSGQILDDSYFTSLGPIWKVGANGNYCLATTWFCTSQVSRGVISNSGGNSHSTGIEMCVNQYADIYDTWQRTAKLVGSLLLEHNIDTSRVVQHNTFTGKNCPQTLRTAAYWDEFMKMIEIEYLIQKAYPSAKISMVSNNPEYVNNTGRVIKQPITTQTVTYTITVEYNNETRTATLSSVLPGLATWMQKDGFYN